MLSRAIARQLGVEGAAVVPGSWETPKSAGLRGARFGLRDSIVPGDVIVALDGKNVDRWRGCSPRLDDHKAGDVVQLTVWRNGKRIQVPVTLRSGEDDN